MSTELAPLRPKVNPLFRDVIPPLAPDERSALEADILVHGCIDPLITWHGWLIDGHNRLEICERLEVPYRTHELEPSSLLPDAASALQWIIEHQLARRNLTPFQSSYLRGKRYLVELQRRDREGQNVPRGDAGTYVAPKTKVGRASGLVAGQHAVNERTVRRDADYARSIDAIAASAGLTVRNDILRGVVRITRRAVEEVASKHPTSLEQVRDLALLCRQTRPSARRDEEAPRAFFSKAIKRFVREGDPEQGRIIGAELSCGHTVPCKARKGDTSNRTTMSCVKCGSGSRPQWERHLERAAFERAIAAALTDQRKRWALTDLLESSLGLLTIQPQREQHVQLLGRVDHALGVLGLLDAPERR